MNYLRENGLLTRFLSAYREFFSTETAIIGVANYVLRAIDSRSEVILALLPPIVSVWNTRLRPLAGYVCRAAVAYPLDRWLTNLNNVMVLMDCCAILVL